MEDWGSGWNQPANWLGWAGQDRMMVQMTDRHYRESNVIAANGDDIGCYDYPCQ